MSDHHVSQSSAIDELTEQAIVSICTYEGFQLILYVDKITAKDTEWPELRRSSEDLRYGT